MVVVLEHLKIKTSVTCAHGLKITNNDAHKTKSFFQKKIHGAGQLVERVRRRIPAHWYPDISAVLVCHLVRGANTWSIQVASK